MHDRALVGGAWLGVLVGVAAGACGRSVQVLPSCGGEACGPGACCVEACGGVDALPSCVDIPTPCPAIYAPVCGCDGVTYGNGCEAHAACVAVSAEGPCEGEPCGAATCAPDACCVTSCGGSDRADQCVVPPEACPEIYGPVCGCDAVTYDNACFAHGACVAIAHDGPCQVVCDYLAPDAEGCPEATVDCPLAGPVRTCVAPAQFDACCCPACV